EQSDDPRKRRRCSAWRYSAVYTAPSTQSGAVLLELSPSRMRDSGWDQLPPDVRFAGEALQKMRAPPWIAIYLNQPLTEKPSCEAGHMTASDFCAARYISSCQAGAIHTLDAASSSRCSAARRLHGHLSRRIFMRRLLTEVEKAEIIER